MKTQTHTPGAWKVSSCSDGREIVSHSCGITFPIAEVCDGLGKANGLKEAQANARLIAAAPEMLGILRRAAIRLESGTIAEINFNHSLSSAIREVIAKAEGRI